MPRSSFRGPSGTTLPPEAYLIYGLLFPCGRRPGSFIVAQVRHFFTYFKAEGTGGVDTAYRVRSMSR